MVIVFPHQLFRAHPALVDDPKVRPLPGQLPVAGVVHEPPVQPLRRRPARQRQVEVAEPEARRFQDRGLLMQIW